MLADIRVVRRRALQTLAGEEEFPRSNTQLYPTHFRCKVDKKNIPWAIEKSLTQKFGSEFATITLVNESEFVIETSNKKESKILPTINSLFSPQFQERVEVEKFACDKINQSEDLIYTYDNNIPDIDDYGSELKKEYNLTDVQKTTRIKTKTLLLLHSYLLSKKKNPIDS